MSVTTKKDSHMHNTQKELPRFLLVGLQDTREDQEKMISTFEEAGLLVETFGGQVVCLLVQNASRGDYDTYIGKGKVEEAIEIIKTENIDVVVVTETIKPAQVHSLKLEFEKVKRDIIVWDKVGLILEIFSRHARTREANLQIRLAKMRQMGPRIYGMGMEMSQQGAGVGTRGLGETNTELMLRHWRDEKRQVQKELTDLTTQRQKQIDHRRDLGLPTISLVGYTNAGKTTLFNRLTGQNDLVQNALFATLDSTVNKFYLKGLNKEIYISDTIGFIKDLPPQLIDAFKSTLLEAVHADILLHVIDATDGRKEEKITTVEEILKEIGVNLDRQIYVFNKSEDLNEDVRKKIKEKYSSYSPVFVSAKEDKGIDGLMAEVSSILDKG